LTSRHHLTFLDGKTHDATADVSADVDLGVRLHLSAGGDRRN